MDFFMMTVPMDEDEQTGVFLRRQPKKNPNPGSELG
jgi:hypothetical protein